MKWYIYLILFAILGTGFYFHLLSIDPLNIILLIVLLITQRGNTVRQEQLAELIKKSHEVTTTNQKIIFDQLKRISNEVRKRT